MDWASAAIVGICAGLGAGIGTLIARLIPIGKAKIFSQIIFASVGAFFGAQFIEPIIKSQSGQYFVADMGERDLIEQLREQPFFARVFDDDPALEDVVRLRLEKAKAQGKDALLREVQQVGAEIGQSKAPEYFKLAQDADLLAAITTISDVINVLAVKDPMLCTAWLFGSKNGQTYNLTQLTNVVGYDKINRINRSLGRLVENSLKEVPVYDATKAQTLVEQAAQAMIIVAGPEALPVIAEAVIPSSVAIGAAACKGVGELYSNLLSHTPEESTFALRHLFASN